MKSFHLNAVAGPTSKVEGEGNLLVHAVCERQVVCALGDCLHAIAAHDPKRVQGRGERERDALCRTRRDGHALEADQLAEGDLDR